jgi:tagatose 1,6-diphosphate aldolase/sulfofructosephosphate aldolase
MTTVTQASLDAIAGEDGVFSIVAMDQRNTLRRMFVAVDKDPNPEALRAAKVDVARALTPAASGILLDPTIGVPSVLEAGALAESCGLLVAAEPESRGNFNGEPRASWLPEQNAAWVRELGGHAVKFLVQLRPGRPHLTGEPDLAEEALEVVRQVVDDCRRAGVPSVVENLIYQLPGEEPLTPRQREDLIVEAARKLDDLGPDLLKLEYPGSPQGCRRIAATVHRPWAVLSAGVAFEEFQDVLRISCDEGGASGFIAGRAIWKEAVGLEGAQRAEFLENVARPRLDDCLAAVSGRARPWREAVSER